MRCTLLLLPVLACSPQELPAPAVSPVRIDVAAPTTMMQVPLPEGQPRLPSPPPSEAPLSVITLTLHSGVLQGPAAIVDAVDDVFVGRVDLLAVLVEGGQVRAWLDGERVVAAQAPIDGRLMTVAFFDGAVRGWFDEFGMGMDGTFRARPVYASRITSRYGSRFHPVDHRTSNHRGTDYGAATGTPVHVTAPGRIEASGFDASAGNNVRVLHSGGAQTLYLHLSRAGGQRVGDAVAAGDVIGYVGTTGKSTGPHLHYELRYAGVSVDSPSMIPEGRTALGPAELRRHREFLASLPQARGAER